MYLNGLVRSQKNMSTRYFLDHRRHHLNHHFTARHHRHSLHALQVLGVHASPFTFVSSIRRLRRRGKVSEFVSVCVGAPFSSLFSRF